MLAVVKHSSLFRQQVNDAAKKFLLDCVPHALIKPPNETLAFMTQMIATDRLEQKRNWTDTH
jgi:hypothetical protein